MNNTNGSNSLTFAVQRHAPELIAPATTVPRELMLLSDIDDQEGLRYLYPLLFLYPSNTENGEVTRLLCGAFIFTARICHALCDGIGATQFFTALGEARGAVMPSILPVWQRELLCARDPPSVTCTHPEYDDVTDTKVNNKIAKKEMSAITYFFGPSEMASLRRFVPENLLKACTNFEVLTACLWRCRTIAQQLDPEQDVHLMFFVNSRAKFNPPIPAGYYGNCIVVPSVTSTAGDLCNKPLGYALELVMTGKSRITEEYVRSTMDLMVVKGRPCFKTHSTFLVTNVSRIGFNRVNFGWGEPLFAGFPYDDEDFPGVYCSFLSSTNDNGESGVLAVFGFPTSAMERFNKELDIMLK